MMSNKGPSAEDERKCLGSMGISQQFGWTGLTASISAALSSSSTKNGASGNKGGGVFGDIEGSSSSPSSEESFSSSDGISSIIASEGLILWNMLGYALKDSDDYQSFVLVNKQWNAMVKLLEPPVIFRINALMAKAAQQKAQQQQQQQQQSSSNNRSGSNNRSNSNNRGSGGGGGGGGGSSGGTGSSNNPSNTLLRQQAVSLLDATYVEMKDRNSGLYRKDNKREAAAAAAASAEGITMSGGGGIAKKWPLVQPNFKMILMLFAHDACSTANLSQQIYEMTRRHLMEISTSVAQTIISIIIEENSSNNTDEDVDDDDETQDDRLNKVLIELIEQWNRWEGLTQIYTDITSYVNRYYVKHHSLTSTTQLANEFLAFALRKSIIAVDKNRKPVVNSIVNLLEKLDPTIMNNNPQKLQSKLILFQEAMVACDKCGQLVEPDQWSSGGEGSNSNNNNNNNNNNINSNSSTSAPSTDEMTRLRNRNIIGRIQTKYNEIKNAFINATGSSSNNNFAIGITTSAVPSRTESDDNNDNGGSNDNITIEFPDGTANIYPSEHFLQSSGLLQNLRLCHGDKIRLQQSSSLVTYRNEFIKAIEFYNIDEHDPMPTIETPIRNWDMNVIVGRTYTNFITSLSSPQLMSIIVFANLMDCKKLLDLATLKVSMQIRTMSPAELRTFFNITN